MSKVVDTEPEKTTDSNPSPFKAQKKVILCRSGKQIYHWSEVGGVHGKPPKTKEIYIEYRPANVVIDAQDLCRSLPVTKEHPDGWVDGKTFNELVGGTTDTSVKVVSLSGEAEGEVGLETTLTFYSDELYDYYKQNKEVSLGYMSVRHFVDNPEEVGYDIILDKIEIVNHVALTSSGRGGSSVAVIDSLFGGLKPMRTGLLSGLNIFSKKNKDFGQAVCDSVKKSKGTTDEELAKDMAGVLDSCATLVDSEAKNTLVDAVKDSFEHKEVILENEKEVAARLNTMFDNAQSATKDSLDSVLKVKTDESEEKTDDSDKKDEPEDKTDDSEKKEEPEEKTDDSDKGEDKEDKTDDKCGGKAKDTAYVTKEELESVKDSIVSDMKAEFKATLKEMFGTEDKAPKGGEFDDVKDSVKSGEELYGIKYADAINY